MIYVVSGYRRSGTTAMMRALNQGGLDFLADKELQSEWNQAPQDGYQPLPDGGLFELGRNSYINPKIMRMLIDKAPDQICIKVFFDGLPVLPVSDYTVIFMRRDADEIEQSMQAVDRYKRKRDFPVHKRARLPFDVYAPYDANNLKHCLDIAKARQDMKVLEVEFRDLVEDPGAVLTRLELPIDIEKAASAIDPDWYRCRVA